MKKMRFWCLVLAALLMFSSVALMTSASAAKESGKLEYTLENNVDLWQTDGYPEVWLTPVFTDYIVSGYNPEKYPANYIKFALPEGALPHEIEYDEALLFDPDKLIVYYYWVNDRDAFELFLEKAEEGTILLDGSDGVAVYHNKDQATAHAMIDIAEYFGGTAKMRMRMQVQDRSVTPEEAGELMLAEVERVKAKMAFVELGEPWTKEAFTLVELGDGRNSINIVIDTTDLTISVASLNSHKLITLEPVAFGEKNDTNSVEIDIESSAYGEFTSATMADGTEYLLENREYYSAAFFYLKPGRLSGDMYLKVRIKCEPDAFAQRLEEVMSRITLVSPEAFGELPAEAE